MGFIYGTCQIRKHIITCFLLMCLASSYSVTATETTFEQLFTDALDAEGQAYIEIRQEILNLSLLNDSYLKEKSKSSDLQVRLLSQAILARAEQPLNYRHFEELMVVPITQAVKYGARTVTGASPFITIKRITQNSTNWNRPDSMMMVMMMRTESVKHPQAHFRGYCHDDSAFLFLAEMALKNTMFDVPELSEQIEWTDDQKTYTTNEVAGMLGVLPETVDIWYKAGVFQESRNEHIDASIRIRQSQVRKFYEFYSDKVINPEYVKSKEPVSRVVHSDMLNATRGFQQDPGCLFRCYAVLLLKTFPKPETPELLYEVYKDDVSAYVRAYCVEGFSAKTQVSQIRSAMKDSSKKVRKEAVAKSSENLDAFTVSEYLNLIVHVIGHRDYQSRELNLEIARILGKKGDTAAIKPLIEMLGYDYYSFRESVIGEALIAIDPNSIYQAFESPNQRIRQNVWRGLAYSNNTFTLKKDYLINYFNHLRDDTIYIPLALRVLAKSEPESLFCFLKHDNPLVRKETIQLLDNLIRDYKNRFNLRKHLPNFKNLILPYIDDSDSGVRGVALSVLGKYSSNAEINKAILEALNDPDPYIRKIAVKNLSGYDKISKLDNVLMHEKNPGVWDAAFHALCNSTDPSREAVILRYVDDEQLVVRNSVALALGMFEDEEAIKALKSLSEDTEVVVQRQAIVSIGRVDVGLLSEILPKLPSELRRAAYNSLEMNKSDAAVDLLIKGTKDDDVSVRSVALWGLTKQKMFYEHNYPAVMAVQKCLSDTDPKIRELAIHVLYEMIGDKSLDQIAVYLEDSEKSVKIEAIRILSRSKSSTAIKYLMAVLPKEEDKESLVEIVRALQGITGNLLTKDEWMQWWEENKANYLKTNE